MIVPLDIDERRLIASRRPSSRRTAWTRENASSGAALLQVVVRPVHSVVDPQDTSVPSVRLPCGAEPRVAPENR
jgi:hypothetical protein